MKRKITIIGVILVLLAATAGYVYFFVYNKAHPDYAELKADFEMEAQALYEAYTSDKEASDALYVGKMIALQGTPHRVEKVDSLTIAVFVFSEGMFGDEGVRCTFLNDLENPIESPDDLTGFTIKGYCTGYNDTDVILEKCSLEKSH